MKVEFLVSGVMRAKKLLVEEREIHVAISGGPRSATSIKKFT